MKDSYTTVKSEIKDAPNYKPPPIIGRTKLPNLYNISRPLLEAASHNVFKRTHRPFKNILRG